MKKNFYSLFAVMMAVVLCVGFTSCSSDDDEDGGSVSLSDLVGTWQCVGWETYDAKGNVVPSHPQEYFYHINADGTGTGYGKDLSGEWGTLHLRCGFEGKTLVIGSYANDDGSAGDYVKEEVVTLTQSELMTRFIWNVKLEYSDGYGNVTESEEEWCTYYKYKKVSDSVLDNLK